MCKECGCGQEEHGIEVNASLTAVNDALAGQLERHLQGKGVLCVNVMGAPGSGKTTLIESLAQHLGKNAMAVIQGDLEADLDKVRLENAGVEAFQINTHSGCHLDASMVNKALLDFPLKEKKYLFIENVGNLVCPAGVRIGQHVNLVVSATTEGSDKPHKYPLIFMDADAVVISKTDLAEAAGFDEDSYLAALRPVIGDKVVFRTARDASSAKGLASFIAHQREHLLGHDHRH